MIGAERDAAGVGSALLGWLHYSIPYARCRAVGPMLHGCLKVVIHCSVTPRCAASVPPSGNRSFELRDQGERGAPAPVYAGPPTVVYPPPTAYGPAYAVPPPVYAVPPVVVPGGPLYGSFGFGYGGWRGGRGHWHR